MSVHNQLESMSKPVMHRPDRMPMETWWELETRRRAARLKSIYSIADRNLYNAIAKVDKENCANSFVYWVSNYGWVTNPKDPVPARRQIPFVLWPDQYKIAKKIIAAIDNPEKIVYLINKTREGGVSWIVISVYYWMWRFRSGFLAKMGSRKQDLVDDKTIDSLFGKLRYVHKRQPAHLREKKTKDILLNFTNYRNTAEIIGESTNAGFGRGGRRTSLFLDEYAHVPREIAYPCWNSIESVAGSIIVPSSPNGPGNKFYDLYCDLPSEWVDEYNWTINPYRDENWKSNVLLSLKQEDFNQEYECSFDVHLGGKVWKFDKVSVTYNEESYEWGQVKSLARSSWQLVGGWDFGATVSNTVNLIGLINYVEDGTDIPDLYIDDELVFNRVEAGKIISEAKSRESSYGNQPRVHYGDPSAKQKESDQMSWEMNLRQGGINFIPLNAWYNTIEGINHSISVVQWMLDSGKLKIHERCRILLESITNWMYNVPDGVPMEYLNKETILPRKDFYSHQTNALMYICCAVRDIMKIPRHNSQKLKMVDTKSHSVGSVMKNARKV